MAADGDRPRAAGRRHHRRTVAPGCTHRQRHAHLVAEPQSRPAELHGRALIVVLSALMLAMLLAALDQTIVSTALPTIVGELGGLAQLSWVVTAYILTSTVSTPLYGKVGDLYGRKRIFQAAIVIFLAGSMLCGIAQNMGELIAFRALQGLGAGGLIVGAQAIVGDLVSPRERGRYMGYFGGVFALATIAGPLIGGFFVDHASWRWVFYVNVPIGVAALAAVATVLHLPRYTVQHRVDYLGAALLAAGAGCIVLLATWGGTQYAWGSPQIIGLGVAGVALLALFVAVELRAKEPIVPMRLLRNSVFRNASAVGFIVGFGLFGAVVFLPQYMQVVRGFGATNSGLLMVPLMGGVLLTSIVSGQLISRTGRYKVFPIAGTALMALGLFLLSTMRADTPIALTLVYMIVLGAGLGMVMQVLIVISQNAVEYRDLGTATSVATFFRAMGGSLGVAAFGAIYSNALTSNLSRLLPGFHLSGLSGGTGNASPHAIALLPPVVHGSVIQAFADSLGSVFLFGVPFGAIAFLLCWGIKEIPLRTVARSGPPAAAGTAPEAASPAVAGVGATSVEEP
ncbi:MAG: MFS transporter [Candidatus Dormibacteraeota bacterium]|nr:MFS transporter [Candidatus Dormibacteraeota bacterium]